MEVSYGPRTCIPLYFFRFIGHIFLSHLRYTVRHLEGQGIQHPPFLLSKKKKFDYGRLI